MLKITTFLMILPNPSVFGYSCPCFITYQMFQKANWLGAELSILAGTLSNAYLCMLVIDVIYLTYCKALYTYRFIIIINSHSLIFPYTGFLVWISKWILIISLLKYQSTYRFKWLMSNMEDHLRRLNHIKVITLHWYLQATTIGIQKRHHFIKATGNHETLTIN